MERASRRQVSGKVAPRAVRAQDVRRIVEDSKRTGAGAFSSLDACRIHVVVPAGRLGPGGMCRMVDYYLTEWTERHRPGSFVVCDPTGQTLDLRRSSWWRLWRQPIHFCRTLVQIIFARITGRIGLVHVHISERGSVLRKMIVIYLSRLLRIPVVGHMHGASFAEFYSQLPTTGQWLVAHAFRQTQRFIVLGSAPKAYFIDTVGLDPNRVTIVHNAVPCIGPVRGSRETMVPQLVFIGIMIERKGLLELLNALARLLHRPWALKIIGDGNAAAWQQIAHDLGVQDRVEFCGWQHTAAVHAVLAFSDILLLPSHNEGLPMVIIEAMAHACAVIATPVGSIKDVVEHNVTGFLVPPRDINALTEAIDRLLTEPGLRHRFGAAGRSRYLESLTMKRMNDQLESIFADAIHRG